MVLIDLGTLQGWNIQLKISLQMMTNKNDIRAVIPPPEPLMEERKLTSHQKQLFDGHVPQISI
jgi:hypothetical protein